MKKREKQAVLKLIGGVGLIFLLIGMFTSLYSFIVGVIGLIASGVLTGALAIYWGVEKKKK